MSYNKQKFFQIKYLLALLLFIATSKTSYSQQAYTLEGLIETSLKNNFQIEIARTNENLAKTRNNVGMAGFLPRIFLSATQQLANSKRDNPTSFINGIIESNSFSPSIGLEQTLFNGFNAHISKENLSLLQKLSHNNVELVILNNIKAIYLNYFQIQAQYELIAYQKQILELSLELYNYNKEKWELGIVTTQELNTYYGFVLEDSLNLLNLSHQIINTEKNLSKVCGLLELKLSEQKINKVTYRFNKETLSDSLKQNPNIRSLYLNERLKMNELKKTKTSLYPTIGLTAGYNFNTSRTTIESLGSVTGTIRDYYLGFSLNYNLFNGNKTQTNIKIAQLNLEVQNTENQQIEQELNIDLSTYIKTYEQYKKQWNLSKKLIGITEKTLDYWKTKQQAGLITSIQLREYQKSNLINKTNELNQWLRLHQNAIEIQSLTNQIVY